jgi:hypothetical protein
MTTRIFALLTGCRASRENNGLTFALKELLADTAGDVVIDSGAGADITVLTDGAVTARGVERDHVTLGGDDVSGYAYCRFGDGITVFYPCWLSLLIEESVPP